MTLLTVTEAARRLDMSDRQVYRLVKSGEIKTYRVKQPILIDAKEVQRYENARNEQL